jgi:Viral BACON domain
VSARLGLEIAFVVKRKETEMRRLVATLLFTLAAGVSFGQTGPGEPAGGSARVSNVSFTPEGRIDTRLTLAVHAAAVPAACTSTETVFCANNGRFAVQVVFSAPNLGINNAPAQATTLTSDTGYFWFFSPNNVELVVKVVDGRAFNNFFWVFYGALSDVAYTVTVTDTQTGAIKTYTNSAGTLASVADTAAFAGGPSCSYTVSNPSPASFPSSGGTGTIAVTALPGCSWTAVSNSSFVTVSAGASGAGNGNVTFSVAANPSGSSRTGTLAVAGENVVITQSGTSPGQFDGSWSGTTSQACTPTSGSAHLCAFTFVVSNNAVARFQVGYAGPVCGVIDAFTTVALETPQPITGSSFQLSTVATPSPGVSATIAVNGSFDTPTAATGNGSVRITTSAPQPDCSTTVPISFTAARN